MLLTIVWLAIKLNVVMLQVSQNQRIVDLDISFKAYATNLKGLSICQA
jgi:hypothetical protein